MPRLFVSVRRLKARNGTFHSFTYSWQTPALLWPNTLTRNGCKIMDTPPVATAHMHTLTAKFQSWRPREMTEELAMEYHDRGIPFCERCADWHMPDEQCSWTELDKV